MRTLITFGLALFINYWTSFAQVEEEVTFNSASWTLYGTLQLPDTTGRHPVIVFLHGSGPNDRNQTLTLSGGNSACLYPGLLNKTIQNFRDLAEGLGLYGYASLRYDKRTYTYSSQLPAKTITPYDFSDDLGAAIDYLKSRSDIDTNRIILLGHSQGATLIPLVARARNDIRALIGLGTGAQGIDTILAMQYRELYYRCVPDTAAGDSIYDSTLVSLGKIRDSTWDENTPYEGAYPLFWRDWMSITDSTVSYYNNLKLPTLLLHAEEDFNIPYNDAVRLDSAIVRDSFKVVFMAGLNHYFTNASSPNVPSFVIDTIVQWLSNYEIKSTAGIPKSDRISSTLSVRYTSSEIIITGNEQVGFQSIVLYSLAGKVVGTYIFSKQLVLPRNSFKPGYYLIKEEKEPHTKNTGAKWLYIR